MSIYRLVCVCWNQKRDLCKGSLIIDTEYDLFFYFNLKLKSDEAKQMTSCSLVSRF